MPSFDPTGTGPALQLEGGLLTRASSGEDFQEAVIHGRTVKVLNFRGDGRLSVRMAPSTVFPLGGSPRTVAVWFKPGPNGAGKFGRLRGPNEGDQLKHREVAIFGWGKCCHAASQGRGYYLKTGRDGKYLKLIGARMGIEHHNTIYPPHGRIVQNLESRW